MVVIKGQVVGEWEDTQKSAEVILRQALGLFNLEVTPDAIVYLTKDGSLDTEIGMLIFVSETEWVFRPVSEYPKNK